MSRCIIGNLSKLKIINGGKIKFNTNCISLQFIFFPEGFSFILQVKLIGKFLRMISQFWHVLMKPE